MSWDPRPAVDGHELAEQYGGCPRCSLHEQHIAALRAELHIRDQAIQALLDEQDRP